MIPETGHVVGGVFGIMVVVGVTWLLAFKKCAKVMVWGMVVVDIGLLCYLQAYVPAVIFAGLCFFMRNRINTAALIMQQAVTALTANPELFGYGALVQLL